MSGFQVPAADEPVETAEVIGYLKAAWLPVLVTIMIVAMSV